MEKYHVKLGHKSGRTWIREGLQFNTNQPRKENIQIAAMGREVILKWPVMVEREGLG